MMWHRIEIYKVTARKGGAILKTQLVKSLWVGDAESKEIRENEKLFAEKHGGDFIANTSDYEFGPTRPEDNNA